MVYLLAEEVGNACHPSAQPGTASDSENTQMDVQPSAIGRRDDRDRQTFQNGGCGFGACPRRTNARMLAMV
jgi:hypothetical protein